MAQPNIDLRDYFGGKSIVLRALPPTDPEFFKPYSAFLTQLTGKWNPNLKNPQGTGNLGGWIFPKKNEPQVRQAVQQILMGQVPAQSTTQPKAFNQPMNVLQQMISRAQAQNIQQEGSASPQPAPVTPAAQPPPVSKVPVFLSPLPQLPGAAPPGYQQVSYVVLKPTAGSILQLNANNNKIAMTVETVQVENGITNQAVVKLPDGQRTMIQLFNDRWIVPGYNVPHTISLS